MGHTGTGPHESSNDDMRMSPDSGWRVQMLAKDEQIRVLTARLAAAEAAARWCYHILVDNQDLSHFYATDQWPWLADEAKGGRDE